jgi:hypothetical protein
MRVSVHVAWRAASVIFGAGLSASQLVTAQSSVKQQPNVPPVAKLEKADRSAPVFIENIGQFDPKVKFQVKIGSQTAWLTSEGIVFDAIRPSHIEKASTVGLKPSVSPSRLVPPLPFAFDPAKAESRAVDRLVFTEDFVQAGCCSKVEGEDPLPGVYNYFQGRDPKQWRTNVRSYAKCSIATSGLALISDSTAMAPTWSRNSSYGGGGTWIMWRSLIGVSKGSVSPKMAV